MGLAADAPRDRLNFGAFALDVDGRVLIDACGREIALRRREFDLLLALARGAGRALSRDLLLEQIAGRQADAFDRTIDIHIGRLRRKIEPDPKRPRLIVTVPGVGYRLSLKLMSERLADVPSSPPEPLQPDPAWSRSAERRHLTVLMCALAETPTLAARLDPEELAPLLTAWRDACGDVVARWGGVVAKAEGDRLTAWFGYPEAREHHAERAIRAGLGIVAAVEGLGARLATAIHGQVAVATGIVLAGEADGTAQDAPADIVGEAPIVAASLLPGAMPGTVMIAESTRHLVGRLFALRELEGLQNAVGRAYEVLGEAAVEDRFAALRGALTPLVGRDEELSLLLRRWRQALSGAGSVVLIAGEPGIGKSRLVRELRGRLAVPSATTITCFCSPYHRDSAYFPIIRHLEGAAGIERGDTGERRQVKLAALLRETETPADAAALLAELLAAPVAEPSPVRDLGPRERRDRTRDALVGQAVALARRRPLLVVFEDAHWSDPTSLEVLDALVERIASLPVLLLVTFRPEFVPPWAGRPRVSSIVLNALDGSEAADMVGHLLGGSAEERLSRAIVDRSGGNPLCVEELSRVARDGEGMALPASLRDSLMARLDRLPAAKAAAQLGAAIGRSFDHALAAAIADMPREELDRGLDALVASGLAGRRGTGPDAIYTFKHVLVQEAAYDTLPRSRRAAIHARIVDALIAQDSTIADFQADLLAHHCKQAGDNARAAAYLIRAGWLSQYRAAYREATEQFNEVLRLVSVMPEGAARDLAELRARRGIGLTIGNSAGYASSQSGSNMFRAAELCERLDYPPEFAGVAFGLHVFHIQRADLAQASDVGERLLAWGRSRDDIRGQVLGHYCAGGVAVIQGELAAARSHLECAVDLYQANLANPAVDWSYRTATSGPRTWGNIHGRLAWIACWSGHLDRVATHISQADRYDEPEVVVITEAINGWLRIFTMSFVNDPASLSEATGALIAYSRQHDLPLFEAQATVLHGYAVARQGDPSSGQGMISEGLAAHAATGSVLYAVYFRALLAETHQMLGEPDVSLSLLNDAISSAEQSGEKWYLAELHRRAAEAYRQLGDDVAAEESFARALAVARRQGARLWELRAATSRARMLHDRGDDAGAAAVLRPVYACFTEGFATVPLREARALLDALDGEAAVRASVTV